MLIVKVSVIENIQQTQHLKPDTNRSTNSLIMQSILISLTLPLVFYTKDFVHCITDAEQHQNWRFTTVYNQRISLGATRVGVYSRSGMTALLCASTCGSDCGMFHFSADSDTCETFAQKRSDPWLTVEAASSWTIGYKEQLKIEDGNWTLAFRAQKRIGVEVYTAYIATGDVNDNPIPNSFNAACLRFSDYDSCTDHFRSYILDEWVNISQVRFSVYKSGAEVAYTLFDGTGTDRESWFNISRIIESSWAPSLLAETLTSPSIYGIGYPPEGVRRFYLFSPHNGCSSDWLYFAAIDQTADPCVPSSWGVSVAAIPVFLYSPVAGRAAPFNAQSAVYPTAEEADVIAVWVKFS